MNSVQISKATVVYSRLNDAYTKLSADKLLSSQDRRALACFLRLHGDRADSMTMMDYWYDISYQLSTSQTITDFNMEIVKNIIFAALVHGCNVLRNCGVEVHDNEEIAA